MNSATDTQPIRSSRKLRRVWALIRKESLEVARDPSSIAIGIVMPVVLVLLFGYGLSLDIKNVPVAVVMEESSADARDLAASFQLSSYFAAEFTASDATRLGVDDRAQGRRHRAHPLRFFPQPGDG